MKKLTDLKGVGPKTLELLNKMGIHDTEELLSFFPFRYDVFKRSNLYELNQDDKIVIDGIIETNPNIFHFSKKRDKMSFRLNTNTHLLNVTIFNRGFLKNKLKIGTIITVVGKYDKKHNSVVASDIKFEQLADFPKVEPVYHSISGITSKQIRSLVDEVLNDEVLLTSYIPTYLKEKYNFLSKEESIKILHNPEYSNQFKLALNHLKYEEMFLFMLKMNYLKNNKKYKIGLKRNVSFDKIREFIDKLPFKLTIDQEKSIKDIYGDLISDKRMNRLLQGDVGSGKTIVSFISIYINFLSGYQGALMAPTEILAHQHFINIKKIFNNININVEILTGQTKSKDKKKIYEKL